MYIHILHIMLTASMYVYTYSPWTFMKESFFCNFNTSTATLGRSGKK